MVRGENKLRLPDFINSLAEEGIVEGSNILLTGPPGVGKTVFCENIVKDYLEEGACCLFVTLEKSPEEITFWFHKNGIDLKSDEVKDRMFYIDGYTWLTGTSKEKFFINSLYSLTELNFKIFSAASLLERPLVLVFNSISPLSLYNPEPFVLKSLQLLLARIKQIRGLGIFVVQSGVHSQEFYNTLEYLVDGIFDMKLSENNEAIMRYFRIRSLSSSPHDARWVPFTINSEVTMEMQFEEEVVNV